MTTSEMWLTEVEEIDKDLPTVEEIDAELADLHRHYEERKKKHFKASLF